MAMRYIIRRPDPENFSSLSSDLPQVEKELEKPGVGMQKTFSVKLNTLERINYLFVTKKKEAQWVWTCPSIELVADNEAGLFSLMERFSIAPPAHLAHLKA